MIEQSLSMIEAKQQLMHLEAIPNITDGLIVCDLIYAFGRHLAGYLNPQLVPSGFAMSCELAIHDLQTGVNGFTGQHIENPLVGYPETLYIWLRLDIPRLAEALFPPEFSAGVKTFIEKVNAKMQAAQADASCGTGDSDAGVYRQG